jgi:predicted secreted protein
MKNTFTHPVSVFCLLLTALTATAVSAGQATETYDRIQLSANASMEVDNDTLTAQLYVQQEGSDLPRLADAVNQRISQAITQIKQVDGIQLQTQDYQTYPTYHQQKVTGWRVRQTLRIRSRDAAKLSQLLSELQSSLALESLQYSVSPERRAAAEEQLIGEAIGSFQQRAKLVTQHLGRSDYRLVEMQINTSDQPVQPVRMRASMMTLESSVSPPSLEAGSQTIRVDVSGSIELQVKQ